jgi:predicted metalloendopeptidase
MNWMDPQSTTAFKNMAECVIDEYNGFCPLSGVINPMTNQTYNPSCINGSQTQGENIADNGGIKRDHIGLIPHYLQRIKMAGIPSSMT